MNGSGGRPAEEDGAREQPQVALATIARNWGRIGCIGFGGPPTHITLLRNLCVDREHWLTPTEFEDGIAATNLLPGPASTQLAIFCAWRMRGAAGAVVGGLCFIVPGLAAILVLSALFFAPHPARWVTGAAAGAGAAVPAVALLAATGLLPGSWRRAGPKTAGRIRWSCYVLAGGASAATIGPWLVLVLAACGILEVVVRTRPRPVRRVHAFIPLPAGVAIGAGGTGALVWVALKVGLLSYGGGFVIVPLMQRDAVHTYHWMTASQFLGAVALGQITPGPVVQTVAVVGYAAAGLGGGLLAAAVAFAPSFVFVLAGASHFDRLRRDLRMQAFLTGAGAASIGAIAGSAVPLATALAHLWQVGLLAVAAVWLFAFRRSVVSALVGGALIGVLAAYAGAPIPH
jgi:chromate transporter